MHGLRSWESFVRIVETGSMAAAARRLDCTRAQISKQVADLEREFGVRLFERSTRKLALTPEWDRLRATNANEQRKLLDEVKKRLARWADED